MKSIFHSETTVTVDGTEYRLESDVTIKGTQLFKVTNLESGETERCGRKGETALIRNSMTPSPFPEDMQRALEQKVDVVVK